jgi:hypothetical protein
MTLDPQQAAKKVLIAYRQLEAMLKHHVGVASAKALAESYDRVLETLRQCFSFDEAFSDSISHLKSLSTLARVEPMDAAYQIEADGKVLLATAHSFIELYLSPEEKRKAIGFAPSDKTDD